MLKSEHKDNRTRICEELLLSENVDQNFLSLMITPDEIWVYLYDVEKRVQLS